MLSTIEKMREEQCNQFKEAFYIFFEKWKKNINLLKQLDHNNRIDILWVLHGQYMNQISMLFFQQDSITEIDKEFLQGILAGMIPVMFKLWVKYPDMGADEMYKNLKNNIVILNSLLREKQ